jgi:hypothetical protein
MRFGVAAVIGAIARSSAQGVIPASSFLGTDRWRARSPPFAFFGAADLIWPPSKGLSNPQVAGWLQNGKVQ